MTGNGSPPNVVLVVTDDQGYGDLSCHGNPTVETPQMDRLHDESVRLTDFHVGTTCAPTRASLLTGRHKLRTGVWHTIGGRSLLRRDERTMADAFSEAGYRTGIFGKWHLGDNYPYRPQERGFDEVFVHGGGGVVQTPDYWGNSYFDDTYFRGDGRDPEPAEGYCTDVWFDEAIDFVERNAASDHSFFCYLPTNAPHAPTQVPDAYRERYEDDVPEGLARFYGMVENIDDNLGRLRTSLAELGIDDETILVFMGDNGAPAGPADHYNAGMRGQKGSPYDGGHRVHCFLQYPGTFEPGPVDELTRHYDLLPTFADFCELDLPDVEIDGQSLRPLLAGQPADPEWAAGTHVVDTQRIERPEKWRNPTVLTDRWRLVNRDELYDVEADPGQETNVAERHPAVVERLREYYEEWWDDVTSRVEDPCRIVLGDAAENPATLTAHDWYGAETQVPWNQVQVLEGREENGYWTVDVAESGTYDVELRRWPRECGAAIEAVPDGFERMEYGSGDGWSGEAATSTPDLARLEVCGVEHKQSVPDGAVAVSFEVELEAGPTELSTTFVDTTGGERGAYYVYVTKLQVLERH